MSPKFVIRLDDFCPGMPWQAAEALERALRSAGVRPVIGVIPDNRDRSLDAQPPRADFWDRVRAWRDAGWTVAQHGHQHVHATAHGGELGVHARSEFAGLPYEAQLERLRRGRDVLEREGVPPDVFMAPSHSYDDSTLRALRALGFRAVTDGYGLFPRERDGLIFVPQLFSRPWHLGLGVYTVCVHPGELSGERLAGLARFCRARRRDIISFPEAMAVRGPALVEAAAGPLLSTGLRALRALRALAR